MSEIMINKIPSPTWNWLKMNEIAIQLPDVVTGQCNIEKKLPASITEGKEAKDFLTDIKTGAGEAFKGIITSLVDDTIIYRVSGQVEEPIVLKFNYEDGQINANKVAIVAEADAKITVVMQYASSKDASGTALVQTMIKASKGAEVNVVQTALLGSSYDLVNDIGAKEEDDAVINIHHLFVGGNKIVQGCEIDLSGKCSQVNKKIGYFIGDEQKLDMNYVVRHRGIQTNCDLSIQGVLSDKASKTFRGTIDFIRGCAGSKGNELEEVILRDDNVVNKTIPVILCQEEDVEGTHGATIGGIAEDLIFYMQSRGLELDEIYELIYKSRLHTFCRAIPDEDLRKELIDFMED